MSIEVEERRIRTLFARMDAVEDVANSLDSRDDRRARLLQVTHDTLVDEGTVRPVIAARLLGLSEKTVRVWAAEGILAVASRSPRLLLDVVRVHIVRHLVDELRAVGKDRDLLDTVWHALADQALRTSADLRESLEQMRRGEGRVVRPGPTIRPGRTNGGEDD